MASEPEPTTVEERIASYLSASDIASLSRVSKYYRDSMEPYLYRDICVMSHHDSCLLSLFNAVMAKPKRAGWVRRFEFGRAELEALCEDEDNDDEEEDGKEDGSRMVKDVEEETKLEDTAVGVVGEEKDGDDESVDENNEAEVDKLRLQLEKLKELFSIQDDAYDSNTTPAIEETPDLTRSPTRSMSPTPSFRSDVSTHGSDDSSEPDLAATFPPASGNQLLSHPAALTAVKNQACTQYAGQVLQKPKKEAPRPTVLSSGSLPTSYSCPDPTYPTLDMTKLWPRLQGAIHHAYPSLSASEINRWQAFLRANTKECRLGLLLQLMPNLEMLKLDITGKPSEWATTVVGMTLGAAPKKHEYLLGLQAAGIQQWEKLRELELRGPGFNMRESRGGRVVCRMRLPLHASLTKIRVFGVEVHDVYIPGDVATITHSGSSYLDQKSSVYNFPSLTNLELVNVAIPDFLIERAVKIATGLERLRVERLKHPYDSRFKVQKWSVEEYEGLVDVLQYANPRLVPEVPELDDMEVGVVVPELIGEVEGSGEEDELGAEDKLPELEGGDSAGVEELPELEEGYLADVEELPELGEGDPLSVDIERGPVNGQALCVCM